MYGKIGRQKMLAEIYKECGSIFGKGNTTMTDKQIHSKELTDGEKLQACCKIIAKILSEQAKTLNSNKINYFLDEITEKATDKFYGNIKVEWNNDR